MKKEINKYKEKISRKPKFKIGDIIVYEDRYVDPNTLGTEDYLTTMYQSKIIEAFAYINFNIENDVLEWHYITEQVEKSKDDSLLEEDISYKI